MNAPYEHEIEFEIAPCGDCGDTGTLPTGFCTCLAGVRLTDARRDTWRAALRAREEQAARDRDDADREAAIARHKREATDARAQAVLDARAAQRVLRKLKADREAARDRAVQGLYALMEHGTIAGYADAPPVAAMLGVFEAEGFVVVDGVPNVAAMLASREGNAGRYTTRFAMSGAPDIFLHTSFYRMRSGRFETIAYTNT